MLVAVSRKQGLTMEFRRRDYPDAGEPTAPASSLEQEAAAELPHPPIPSEYAPAFARQELGPVDDPGEDDTAVPESQPDMTDIAAPDDSDQYDALPAAAGGGLEPPEPPDAPHYAYDTPEEPEQYVPVYELGLARFQEDPEIQDPPDSTVVEEYLALTEEVFARYRDDGGVDYTDAILPGTRRVELTSEVKLEDGAVVGSVVIIVDTNSVTSLDFVDSRGNVERTVLVAGPPYTEASQPAVAQISPGDMQGSVIDPFDSTPDSLPDEVPTADPIPLPRLTREGLDYIRPLLEGAVPAEYSFRVLETAFGDRIEPDAVEQPSPVDTAESVSAARQFQQVVRGTLEAQGYDRTGHTGAILEMSPQLPPREGRLTVHVAESGDSCSVHIRDHEIVGQGIRDALDPRQTITVNTIKEVIYTVDEAGLHVMYSSKLTRNNPTGGDDLVLAHHELTFRGEKRDASVLRNFLRHPSREWRRPGTARSEVTKQLKISREGE